MVMEKGDLWSMQSVGWLHKLTDSFQYDWHHFTFIAVLFVYSACFVYLFLEMSNVTCVTEWMNK
jgi:hypothetical protein